MTTTSDLARQLAAHPRFPGWEEGMAFHENATPGAGLYRDGRGRVLRESDGVPHAATPDLTDAATAGVLLSWLGDVEVHGGPEDAPDAWGVLLVPRSPGWLTGATLGEAAARALLSLWGPA